MVQMSSFYLKCNTEEKAKECLESVVKQFQDYNKAIVIEKNIIKTAYDVDMPYKEHQRIFKFLYKAIATINDLNYVSKNEYYSDDLELHESVVRQDGYIQHYVQKEEYSTDINETKLFFGKINDGFVDEEEYDEYSFDLDEEMCPECGEYVKKHMDWPFCYCPYCGHIEVMEIVKEEVVDAKWKEYKFEIPLGIELPHQPISMGQDWISDCEEDTVFGLNPVCFESLNQYNAALRLCRVCAGWYHFDSDIEKEEQLERFRAVLRASKGEPMWYFDIWQNTFDFLSAIKENHPQYQGKFLEVNDLWDLFNRLHQRSYIQKAECFDWIIDFFGDALRYETRYKMTDIYVQNYFDNHMESILYNYPHQIEVLTKSVAKISSHSCANLSRAAAGLIRMGKRDLGLSLYKKLFAMVWTDKSSVDEKKQVVDFFIERLSMGYENEQYIDDEIATLLEKQCSKYSDGAWSSKIRMNLGRNKQ